MAVRHGGWSRLLVAGCCALSLAAAKPARAVVLRTSAQEGTEPKFIATAKNGIVGLCIDIMRAVEQVDPSLVFSGDQKWMPLIRAYSELETGQQDVQCAVQRSAQREQKFIFLQPALYTVDYHFLVRADDNVVVNTWDDVRHLAPNGMVLINRGFAAGDIVTAMGGIEVDASSSHPELNLQKLIAGRGRLYFHRGPGLHKLLERTGTAKKVKILPKVMFSARLYFATSKQLDASIRDRLVHALLELEKKGDLERLMRKWD